MWPRGYWPVGYWPVGYWPGMQAATVSVSAAWLMWYYFSIQGQISHTPPGFVTVSGGGRRVSVSGGGRRVTVSGGGRT